jgi:membrane protein required for colicin V production
VEWPPLNWIDIGMLAAVAVSALVGLRRGITYELLSLAGWFVAYFAARWLAPDIAAYVTIGHPGSALNHVASFACAFLIVLVLWSLVAKMVSSLIAATPLRPVDRLLGAVFGLLRGCVLLLVVATVVVYTPYVNAPEWRQSVGAAVVESLLRSLLPFVPADVVLPQRAA